MGKGKGERAALGWPVPNGQILLEVGRQVYINVVRKLFSVISFQFSVPTKLVKKHKLR